MTIPFVSQVASRRRGFASFAVGPRFLTGAALNGRQTGNDKDQYFTYDDLHRLAAMNRGTLSSGTISDANANLNQDWQTLEALGNWAGFRWDGDGGADGWTKREFSPVECLTEAAYS